MKNILSNKYLNLIIRLIIGYIFIYAALGKIVDPLKFSKEIFNYHMMPDFTINVIALILPWLELTTGVLLIFGIKIKANSVIMSALMFIFIAAVFSAMVRGLNINCGCFSDKIVLVGWPKILENLSIFLGCIYLFFFSQEHSLLDLTGKTELSKT